MGQFQCRERLDGYFYAKTGHAIFIPCAIFKFQCRERLMGISIPTPGPGTPTATVFQCRERLDGHFYDATPELPARRQGRVGVLVSVPRTA